MGTESTGDLQSELMQAREAKVVLLDEILFFVSWTQ